MSESPAKPQPFSFWTVGPITGASVGLTHVLAMAAAWAAHGYPDFLIRNAESAIIFAGAMAIGGAIFGVLYAAVVAIGTRAVGIVVRPRLHFWMGTIASFVITYFAADVSLRRRDLISPFLVLAAIVSVTLVMGLLSAKRSFRADQDSR